MALSGKTIQYTLAVNMETGQLTAESQKVAKEINLIQKQTQIASSGMLEFGRSVKSLKSELSLLFLGAFGGYSLAVGILGDALSAAAEKTKEFIVGIKLDQSIVNNMREYAKSLRDASLSQDEIISGKIREYSAQIELNRLQNENVNNQRSLFVELALAFGGKGFDFEKIQQAYNEWINSSNRVRQATKELTADQLISKMWKEASADLDKRYSQEIIKLKNESIAIDKQAKAIHEDDLIIMRQMYNLEMKMSGESIKRFKEDVKETPIAQEGITGFNVEKTGKERFQFTQGNLLVVEAKNAKDAASANRELAEARYSADQSLANAMPLMDLVPSKFQMMQGAVQSLVSGFVDGFASIGEAIVNGTSGLKGFGAIFLKTIAQLAIQFGTFLILTGIGISSVPLFGLSGGAAIAAGVALTVFGGALGAIASKMGSGRSNIAAERESRFQGSSFGGQSQGGQVINNYVTFTNAIGLDDRSRQEVAEYIGAELFKQNRLGRLNA